MSQSTSSHRLGREHRFEEQPYRGSAPILMAESKLEVIITQRIQLEGAPAMVRIALRLAVAWILLSLFLAGFWVLFLELSRRLGGSVMWLRALSDARRSCHPSERNAHGGDGRGREI